MAKRCSFDRSWLTHPQFTGWLVAVYSDPYSAYCNVCCRQFSLSNMGKQAILSHRNSKKHLLGFKARATPSITQMLKTEQDSAMGSSSLTCSTSDNTTSLEFTENPGECRKLCAAPVEITVPVPLQALPQPRHCAGAAPHVNVCSSCRNDSPCPSASITSATALCRCCTPCESVCWIKWKQKGWNSLDTEDSDVQVFLQIKWESSWNF